MAEESETNLLEGNGGHLSARSSVRSPAVSADRVAGTSPLGAGSKRGREGSEFCCSAVCTQPGAFIAGGAESERGASEERARRDRRDREDE